MSSDITEFAAFFNAIADESGKIARNYFRTGLAIEDKADESPVTRADKEGEIKLRELIEARYPDHGIVGEEFGATRPDADYVWSLDPIDGTKAFITGRPLYGTLVGLLHKNKPILGMIDHPSLRERWIGGADYPTRFNGELVKPRECAAISDAVLANTAPEMFVGANIAAFERVRSAVKMPVYGGDCYNYGLVASGCVDLVIEATMSSHDYLPLVGVLEGAGAIVTDWNGDTLHMGSGDTVLAAGDRRVHAAAVELLNAA